MKYTLFIFGLLLLVSGCKKGSLNTNIIELPYFNNVEVNNSFEIELIEGHSFRIEISSDNKNNLDKVSCEIINDELIIEDKRKFKFLKPGEHISLKIHAPEFFLFRLKGGVTLTNKTELNSNEIGVIFEKDYNFVDLTLNNNAFYFWNEREAGGEIKLSGNTTTVKFWYTGLVKIDAKNVLAQSVIFYSNSRIDSEIYASQNVDCKIVGEGNVYLYGNPPTILNHSDTKINSGKLILKD